MRSGWAGKVWVGLGLFGLILMRLGSKYIRLWNVSYLSTSFIIVKCRSLRVLTKALFNDDLPYQKHFRIYSLSLFVRFT